MALTPQQQNTLIAIKSAAAAHNVDWRVMASLAHHESNLGQSTYGDGGHAIGPFQLNNAGGVLTGLPEKEYQSYANPRKNADYAANALARLGITRGSGSVESQIQQGVNRFERPANKGAEIADATQWYRSTLAGANPNAVTTPAAGVAKTTNKGMAQQVQPAAATPLQDNRLNLLAYTMQNTPQARASGVAPSLGNLLLSQLMNPQQGAPMMPQQQTATPKQQATVTQPTITGQTPTSAMPPGKANGGYASPLPANIKWTRLGVPYQGTHTKYGNWESDNAIDMGVPIGTPIYAPASGVIGDRIGPMGNDGLRVNLAAKGNAFYLAHMSKLAVKAGQQVKKGDVIGYSGASSNGAAHLHIAVQKGDPRTYFNY